MIILSIGKPKRGNAWCDIADSEVPPGVKHRYVTYIAKGDDAPTVCKVTDGLEELFDRWSHLCDRPAEICEEIETAQAAGDVELVLSFYPNHYLST